MDYLILGCVAVTIILILVNIVVTRNSSRRAESKGLERSIEGVKRMVEETSRSGSYELSRTRDSLIGVVNQQFSNLSQNVNSAQKDQRDELSRNLNNQRRETRETMEMITNNLTEIRTEILKTLADVKESNANSLKELRRENQESMDKINETVNEKLQKTLDDRISKSFETVRTQLAEVYKGLGEMKEVASGVTDLKKVLSNVKTRGIVGEVQLDAILSEILTLDQYEVQFRVKPSSQDMVDFAIKLPGSDDKDSNYVYLPIDSKFPGDSYNKLVDAYETGDAELIKSARKNLEVTIKAEAKSINEKYINPPLTTDFAVMFLPFEGLYAEAVNMGLIDELQSKYHINIAGPSTMAAMLNSFRMGFRALAVQKRSGEVWKTLEAVQLEFANFETVLSKMKNQLRLADENLDKLIGTRTRAINRKLRAVSSTEGLSLEEADEILGIDNIED